MVDVLPTTASLRGLRVACFYPWNAFEPTGAWTRFTCLWKFLVEQGAEVTLAFLDKGNDARLEGVSVRYSGEHTLFNNVAAMARAVAAAQAMQELKQYSPTELNFLLRYEKGLYLEKPAVGAWLDELVSGHDVITCEYPMYAPLLAGFCKKWSKPLVVSCLDMLFELHGSHPRAKERLKQMEVRALGLADALVFCNDDERKIFEGLGLKGVTVLNTGDALSVIPGQEEKSRGAVRSALKIKTAHYCLFVGSPHAPNMEAVGEIRRMAKTMPDITFVVAGSCCAKAVEGNFVAVGHVVEEFLATLHRGALAVLVPLVTGTGNSVKLFHAFTYGKAVVATPTGARGHAVADGTELLLAAKPADFPACIRRLMTDGALRKKLEAAARAYAVKLDYRTHFRPYGEILLRLTNRTATAAPRRGPALILADNNLTDQIGHHLNYALALKEQCVAQGCDFHALIKRGAIEAVRAALSAEPVFSQGIHEDSTANPYPVEWGQIRSTYDLLLANDVFARELEVGLTGRAAPGDTVLLPNATPRQMLGVALLLLKNPIFRTLNYVLILRYSVYTPSGPLAERKLTLDKETADRYAMALQKLTSVDWNDSVRLATDSEELAKEYGAYTTKPIEVLPIPHTTHPLPPAWPAEIPVKDARRKRVVYLGDAREEKGFELLPAAVRACATNPALAGTEFVFQAFISSPYHYGMVPAIDELVRLRLPNLHLITAPLSSDAYQALLDSADLVVLPYDAATYRARTSGPFVEAICASKPVVVPGKSWLSGQLGVSQAGVMFVSGNAADFARAVTVALTNLPVRAAAAEMLGASFRAYHNPATFVRCLVKSDEVGEDSGRTAHPPLLEKSEELAHAHV